MIDSAILGRYSLFGGLERTQIDNILPLMTQESYEANTDIIVEGNQNDKIRFILEGRVAVVKSEKILAELGKGDTIGEMEVLDIMPAEATVRTIAPTQVITLSNAALRKIYETDIKVFAIMIMNLARDISRRLRRMDNLAARESPPTEWS